MKGLCSRLVGFLQQRARSPPDSNIWRWCHEDCNKSGETT